MSDSSRPHGLQPTKISNMVDSFYKGLVLNLWLVAVLIYDVQDPTRMNDYNVPYGPYARYHAANFLPYGDPSTAFIFHCDGPSLTQFESELYVSRETCNLVRHYNSPTHWETNWSVL